MQIILSGKEKEALRDVAGMIGFNMLESKEKAVEVSVKQLTGETTVDIEPEYVLDVCGFFIKVMPMIKGVIEHGKSIMNVMTALGQSIDAKWTETKEREAC